MSGPRFTPGPWTLDGPTCAHVACGDYHIIEGGVGFHRATFPERGFRIAGIISADDARLMTVAPKLYDAVRGALVVINTLTRPEGLSAELAAAIDARRAALVAAIAEAEGRS